MRRKLIIVGLGEVGGHVLEFLARTSSALEIIAVDINEDLGVKKTNNVIFGAAHQGFYPDIRFVKIDLDDIDETIDFLKNTKPDLIFNSATLQSWWVLALLPKKTRSQFQKAGLGPWTPLHLTLTYKLMAAVKKSGIGAHVVSAPYPDVVNPVLGRIGLAPTVGIGNIDLLIPKIKWLVSNRLATPICNISIFMIAHHSLVASLSPGGEGPKASYFLKVLVGDKVVTEKFDTGELLSLTGAISLPPPRSRTQQIASSAVKNILAILDDTGELTHAPGPEGLPGGYPVRLSAKGAEVVLPDGITMAQAIRINEDGQLHDGIQEIKDDGTIVFTEKANNIMRKMLGYDCKEMKISESDNRARELTSLFRTHQKTWGKQGEKSC